MSTLKSISGHQMRGAEKENRDGRHSNITLSAWSILRSSGEVKIAFFIAQKEII